MRYYNIKILSSIFFSVILTGLITAQETNFSPYSRYGIGELNGSGFCNNFMMSGLSLGYIDNLNLNPGNPASYAFLRQPVLEVAGRSDFFTLKTNEGKSDFNLSYLSHFGLGFPLLRGKGGLIMALTPYSKMGYTSISEELIPDTEIEVRKSNIGEGGINRLFTGFGYKFNIKEDTNRNAQIDYLALGFNFNYLFGNLAVLRDTEFPINEGYLNTRIDDNTAVKNLSFDFGVNYGTYLKRKTPLNQISYTLLNVSGSFLPEVSLNATKSHVVESYITTASGIESTRDSIESFIGEKGNISLPSEFGLGFTLTHVNNSRRQFLIGAEYRSQDWNDYHVDFEDEILIPLAKRQEYILGLTYLPSNEFGLSSTVDNYFRAISYRAGLSYKLDYLSLQGEQLEEYGISFGMELPILQQGKKQTTSAFHFGLGASRKGVESGDLLEETKIKVLFGVRLNPDFQRNPWFAKRKYD